MRRFLGFFVVTVQVFTGFSKRSAYCSCSSKTVSSDFLIEFAMRKLSFRPCPPAPARNAPISRLLSRRPLLFARDMPVFRLLAGGFADPYFAVDCPFFRQPQPSRATGHADHCIASRGKSGFRQAQRASKPNAQASDHAASNPNVQASRTGKQAQRAFPGRAHFFGVNKRKSFLSRFKLCFAPAE